LAALPFTLANNLRGRKFFYMNVRLILMERSDLSNNYDVVIQHHGAVSRNLSALQQDEAPTFLLFAWHTGEAHIDFGNGTASTGPENRLLPAGGSNDDPQDEAQRARRRHLLRVSDSDRRGDVLRL
jgi:hypothetical protein